MLPLPAAIAPDAMQPRVPPGAAPLSELPNESWKSADGVVLSDKLSSHCGAFSPKSFLLRADAVARQLGELSKAQ
jgi:hypothetical protein